jgi:hypothetical protein
LRIPLSCDGFYSNAGLFTRSVDSRDRSNLQRRPHLTDLARLTKLKSFPVKGYACARLGCDAGRGVICKSRPLQYHLPIGTRVYRDRKDPRRYAALKVLRRISAQRTVQFGRRRNHPIHHTIFDTPMKVHKRWNDHFTHQQDYNSPRPRYTRQRRLV